MLKLAGILIAVVCVNICVTFPQNEATNCISKTDSIKSNLQTAGSNGFHRYPNYTECGGVIDVKLDQLVVIEYKLNEEYNNNEMCVWTLRNNEAYAMLLTKTSSGFEPGYDFLQIFPMARGIGDAVWRNHMMGNETGIEQYHVNDEMAFLVFSTDSSNTGTGFRFEIAAHSDRYMKYWEDDFVSRLPSGTHSLRPYFRDTMTSWVITPNEPDINLLELRVEYNTEVFWDEIIIFQLERNGGSINWRFLDRISGVGAECYAVYHYTTYVIFFVSDSRPSSSDGEGITIHWLGSNSSTSEACTENIA